MKNRFNWIFELLKTRVLSAQNDYLRGANPAKDRENLMGALGAATEQAQSRMNEFPDHEQYFLFLDDYVGIIEDFMRDVEGTEDLTGRMEHMTNEVITLEDEIRAALK